MIDRIPPHNVEAEQAVLGAIFLSADAIETAAEIIQPDDFYATAHQRIYKAMLELHDKGEPIDLVTVMTELQDRKLLDEVGGPSYITGLASSVPTAANIKHYAQIVAEKAIQRRTIENLTTVLADAYDAETVESVLAKAEQVLSEIQRPQPDSREFTVIRDALLETYSIIERRYTQKSKITGIPSGYPDLDKMTSGFQRSDLIILAARPSVGKTAFALNVAQNVAARAGETVAIFSLEMSYTQLAQRIICAEGNLDASKLRTGWLDEDDWKRITEAIGVLSKAPIFINDTPNITVAEIRRKSRKLKQRHSLGLIIIDYLQLIQVPNSRGNRQEQVTEVSRQLKMLAKELDVPVIALSQLSRSVEQRQDKRPMLSDLRESGAIEQDADIVAFLYRDDYYDRESEKRNVVEVIIAKQRNGPTGTVELAFLKEFNKFVSLEVQRSESNA